MLYRYLHILTFASVVSFATGHVYFNGLTGYANNFDFVNIEDNVLDDHHHRSLAQEKELKLQLSWWNWALCATPFPYSNANFTPMSGVVPKNTVFLAGYPTFNIDNSSDTCKSKTITRRGTITPGQQTVFMSLTNGGNADSEDDWEKNCTLRSEIDAKRISNANSLDKTFTDLTLTGKLYFDIDGKSATPFYLYDETKNYLSACDDKDQTLADAFPGYPGDSCDNELFETIGGMDVGPLVGWYGIDTRTWADGERHTYEFGSISECVTAKYVLTAKSPCTVSWDIYNSKSDKFVTTIAGNSTTIKNPPPCGRINIEAVVPSSCASKNITRVTIELYHNDRSNNKLIRRKNETIARYFLFGNRGNSINDGKIKDGKYKIRAIVNGKIVTPFTTFVLATGRCN